MTSRVDPPSFGIDYGSSSFGQLSGYIVFCLLIGGLRPSYRYGTKYNVARKMAKRNGAIIYAKAGRNYLLCTCPYFFEWSDLVWFRPGRLGLVVNDEGCLSDKYHIRNKGSRCRYLKNYLSQNVKKRPKYFNKIDRKNERYAQIRDILVAAATAVAAVAAAAA